MYGRPRRLQPLPRCIILDLDETLVHSSYDYRRFEEIKESHIYPSIKDRFYNIYLSGSEKPAMWGVTRPYLDDFINFCFNYFECVCVWSAGTKDYVDEIVKNIFPYNLQPHVIFSRDDCSYTSNNEIFKPMSDMIDRLELHSILRHDNTFFIDDRDLAFIKNPGNGIVIPVYEPKPITAVNVFYDDDRALHDLMVWFSQPDVSRVRDVRSLDKTNIFKNYM